MMSCRHTGQKIILAALLLVCFFLPGHAAQWEPVAPLNDARDQFTAGVINGIIYAFGGNRYPDGLNLKSTESYDPADNAWVYRADNEHNNGMGVEELSGAEYDGKLYVFGAYGGGDPYGVFNFVEEYDPETNLWTSKAPKPTIVSGAPAVEYNGEIFLFGGSLIGDGDSRPSYIGVEAYSPSTNTWRLVTQMPSQRTNMAIGIVGSKAYLIGGLNDTNVTPYSEIIAYDFELDQWVTSGLGSLSLPRFFSYSTAAPVIDGKIYLIGGMGCGSWAEEECEATFSTTGEVSVYDPSRITIFPAISLPNPIDFHASVKIGSTIYVIGGNVSDETSTITNQVWKLEALGKAMPWIPLLLLSD